MKIYHTTLAGGSNQIGADEWNEEHTIEDYDDFVYEFGVFPTRKDYGVVSNINGAYTLTLDGDTTLYQRFGLVLHIHSRATNSDPCKILLRFNSNSNPDNYAGTALKVTDSGVSNVNVEDSGGGIIVAEPIQTGNNISDSSFSVFLDGWIRGKVLGFSGESKMLYPSLTTYILRADYSESTDFTTTPSVSVVLPSNSYTTRLEYEVYRG